MVERVRVDVKPMSVNAAWQGKRFKTKLYRAYEAEVMAKLDPYVIPPGDIELDIEFGLSNTNSDWDNPIKPFVDILQQKYQFNDRRIQRAIVEKKKVVKGEEYIEFSIKSYEP